ncbi:MAG: amino acid ABC transporter permease [Acidimicrobiales bacterium]
MTGLVSTGPAAERRRAPAVRTRLRASVVAVVAAITVWAVLAALLWGFDRSLGTNGWETVAARAVLLVLALAGLAVPVSALQALRASLAARRLAASGDAVEARVAGDRASNWLWYVVGFSITALAVGGVSAVLTAGVRAVFFDWRVFGLSWPALFDAFWLNIRLFLVAELFVLVWGLVVAVARMMPGKAGRPVRFLSIVYTDLFRGMPAVLVIFLVVFGLAIADLPLISDLSREQQRFWLPVLALTLVYGAYVAEVYRSGLESIHWSQTAAARSLGLSFPQTLRFVVVPQAVRRVIPPLLNDFIGLQKDTALLAFVGVLEVFNTSSVQRSRYFNMTPVVAAGVLFVIVTIPLARLTDWLIKRDQGRMRAGG